MIKKILLLFLLIWTETVYCQLTANFTSDDSVGCNSLIVQFNNTSSGGTTPSYKWDFGNGNTSTLTNPQIVYNVVGSYTVTLIVYDQSSSDTLVKQKYIIVNKGPVISAISAGPQSGCLPFETELSATVEYGNAPLYSIIWDFGNGKSSDQLQPRPTYTSPGKYTPSVFVTDTNHCQSSYSVSQLVTAIANPVVNFTALKNIACVDTLTVNFKNLSSGSTALTYLWDFGNGQSSSEKDPKQFYNGFNNYTVTLIGTDASGCTTSLTKSNFVSMQDINASVTISDKYLCKYENLQIINNTVGANHYNWTFGDGTNSAIRDPFKNYQDTGTFKIVYAASLDNYCFDTVIINVRVDPVTAKFASDKNYGCEFPLSVQYNNTSVEANNWYWIFGDKTTSILENPNIEYSVSDELKTKRNIYLNDTLIAESSMNCRDTFVIANNIHLHYPNVYFTPNDSSNYKPLIEGCIPISVDFVNQSKNYNNDDPFVDVQWNFGDNTTSQLNNPKHNYNQVGEFATTLSITNQSGCVNSYTANINTGTVQKAKFSYTGNPVVCGSDLVGLKNESTDSLLIDAWLWVFSEGTVVEVANPLVQFTDTGFVSGELTVTYNGCKSSPYKVDSFIYVNGPAGNVQLSLNCDEPFKYYFQSNVNGADSWYYGFGDNTYDSTQNLFLAHEYPGRGDFNSFLQAENINSGCTLLVKRDIFVRDLLAQYQFSPSKNCPGDSILFDPNATIDKSWIVYENKLGYYLWDFGDGSKKELGFGLHDHIYEKPGTYDVTLSVSDVNGCKEDLTKPLKIQNVAAHFSISDSVGCAPFVVDFIDTSIADTTLATWLWKFGNDITDTNQNITKTFVEDTSYTIMLIVTDVVGCKDTLIRQNAIYSSNPIPLFQAIKTNNCINDSLTFKNLSTGRTLKNFEWDFGNATTSTLFEPKIAYSDTGFFNLSLRVNDSLGCNSQLVKSNYIYIQPKPVVNFSTNSVSSSCYPKGIGFIDETVSNDISKLNWFFGDKDMVENISNPYHTYQRPGKFDVKLIAVTSLGCTDSLIKNELINIGGPYVEIMAPDTSCINIPIPIGFDNEINIYDFQWTLEGGGIFNTREFVKTYDSFGNKKFFLYLESDSLGTCNKLLADSINLPILEANFTLDDTAECIPYNSFTHNLSTNGVNFEWYVNNNLISNLPEPDLDIDQAGWHEIKMVALNTVACRDSLLKNVRGYPLPKIVLNNDTLICQFDSILLHASGGINYYWYNKNTLIDSVFSNIKVFPLVNEKYNLTVKDENSCINYDSVLIEVQPKPTAFVFNSDTTLIIGEGIELNAIFSDGDNIQWEPTDYLSCSNCESAFALPLETTLYTLTVSDNNNCFLVSDSVTIFVDAKYSVDVPTSFTPNGDGVNDVLFVMGWGIKNLCFLKFMIWQAD